MSEVRPPDALVTGRSTFPRADCTAAPPTMPAAPRPTMPRNTRRPTGVPERITARVRRPGPPRTAPPDSVDLELRAVDAGRAHRLHLLGQGGEGHRCLP